MEKKSLMLIKNIARRSSINEGKGQISYQKYEDKVKEAFRQMGIEIG
jgi:hypothetical protein